MESREDTGSLGGVSGDSVRKSVEHRLRMTTSMITLTVTCAAHPEERNAETAGQSPMVYMVGRCG